MREIFFRAVWPVLAKSVLPAALGALGATVAVVWSDGFRAFCEGALK